jgi:hypothetical protein
MEIDGISIITYIDRLVLVFTCLSFIVLAFALLMMVFFFEDEKE